MAPKVCPNPLPPQAPLVYLHRDIYLGTDGMTYMTSSQQQQLKDPSLFKQDVCYVNGEWVKAKSGKTFEVRGT